MNKSFLLLFFKKEDSFFCRSADEDSFFCRSAAGFFLERKNQRPFDYGNRHMTQQLDQYLRLAEALIFASNEPTTQRSLTALLPEDIDADTILRELQKRYEGRGVELVQVGLGWQFRTAPDLAGRLTRTISRPRRLPRVAMETLAIIAWHQPVTRAQIEEIRGASLSQATLDALLEASLIKSAGHRDVPGRPALWATTQAFLTQFALNSLSDLPKRSDLLLETVAPTAMASDAPAEPT
jgi:segregation and condensation protein B